MLPSSAKAVGDDEAPAGAMSATRTVPALVPSLFQGSKPEVPSVAEKYSRLPSATGSSGSEPPVGLMSLTMVVPTAVPSLFHSSAPFVPSFAVK